MSELPPGEFPGEATLVGEGIERIVDLGNDVFGFSLTLLAVSIAVPALPAALAAVDLGPALLALWPKAAVFALSFFTVSLYWVVYQRIFRFIRYYDSWLLWLHQASLLFVAFMPISSAVLGLYPCRRQPSSCSPATCSSPACPALRCGTMLSPAAAWSPRT